MKRRTFINFIASAIIGTAIALKLPDGLVPLNHLTEKAQITFHALAQACFMSGDGRSDVACIVVLSESTQRHARDLVGIDQTVPASHRPYFFFQEAVVVDDTGLPPIPDDVIQVHSRNGVIKEYYFA